MWTVVEAKEVTKTIAKSSAQIAKEYAQWLAIVRDSGPDALRAFRGMNDEALSGQWKGFRSSRLSGQWRVFYRVAKDEVAVYVVRATPHDYRK